DALPIYGGAVDDGAEADLLARKGQGDDADEQRPAGGDGQHPGRGRADGGAEHVRAGVAEHAVLAQVRWQSEQPWHERGAGEPRPAPGTCSIRVTVNAFFGGPSTSTEDSKRSGRGEHDLQRSAGAEVEQVREVRAASDESGVGPHAHEPAGGRGGRRRGEGEDRDAERLRGSGGEVPLAQRPEVAAQSLGDGAPGAA